MARQFDRFNDGSQNPPRLRVEHSMWSLGKLPMNAPVEWTLEEKLANAKQAGFEAVNCGLVDSNEREIKDALDAAGLRLVIGDRPFDTAGVRQMVDRARRLDADFIFVQPASAFHSLDHVTQMITEGRAYAEEQGVPMFVETHRNNFTENIPQTLQLLERIPDIRFTADLSHFVVVGEFYGWEDEGALERMLPVLQQTSHIHGRIGNGEQVQVDVGDGSGETPQFFVRLWTEAMRHWLKGAGPGDIFPFTSELGPPRYAITLPDGSEFSDRWEQSLVMKKLAEQAWANANS